MSIVTKTCEARSGSDLFSIRGCCCEGSRRRCRLLSLSCRTNAGRASGSRGRSWHAASLCLSTQAAAEGEQVCQMSLDEKRMEEMSFGGRLRNAGRAAMQATLGLFAFACAAATEWLVGRIQLQVGGLAALGWAGLRRYGGRA